MNGFKIAFSLFIFSSSILPCSSYDETENLSRGKPSKQYQNWDCLRSAGCHKYEPQNAIDENTDTCTRTKTINKETMPFTWWYVDLGEVKSIFNIRILFKSYDGYVKRQRGRFAGFSLYLSNSTNKEEGYLCYIDGPELPPLDFNTTCIGHGRYIIYFNERFSEGQYPSRYPDGYPEGFEQSSTTELCDVDVQGCNETGKYGSNCSLKCSGTCQENRCYIEDGTCFGCKTGWIGKFCDKVCPVGSYGLECKLSCGGYCKYNASCNHVTGLCDHGCGAGWTGRWCNKICPVNTFGEDCKQRCGGHCSNNGTCNQVTGVCDNGCADGYHGSSCSSKCASETFGTDCKKRCSGHCINNKTCNHITGMCDNGCADGYRGSMCDSACSTGHFGKTCSGICSTKCLSTCNHVDGSCDCTPGWKGTPNCSEECPSGYFGINCIHQCSRQCAYNDACNKVNGSCPRGCQKSYMGYQCQCKSLDLEMGGSCMQTDVTESRTIGLFLSVALNVILICAILLPLTRAQLKKRKCHESSITILDTGTYPKGNDTDQMYQDLGTLTEASNYQDLRQLDNKCVYQNYTFRHSE